LELATQHESTAEVCSKSALPPAGWVQPVPPVCLYQFPVKIFWEKIATKNDESPEAAIMAASGLFFSRRIVDESAADRL